MAGRMGSRAQRAGRARPPKGCKRTKRGIVCKAKRVRGSSSGRRTRQPQVRASASSGRELRGGGEYSYGRYGYQQYDGPHKPGPCSLRRVRVDQGGYVSGQYFGRGAPLYEYDCPEEGTRGYGHVRAGSRAAARAQVLKKFPGSKIRK